MKKKLLLCLSLAIGSFSFAQFTTGVVTLSSSTGRTIKIDTNATTVTMTLTGSSTRWLGVGFGGGAMATSTDMFIWNATTNIDYTPSGAQSEPSADAAESQSWTISSDTVVSGVRTVIATRPLVSAGDYTFLNDNSSITIIFAEGSTTTLGYHGANPHSSQILTRTQLGVEDFSLKSASVFPNPTKGDFSVQAKTSLTKINIYTQTGAFVKTIDVSNSSDNAEVNVKGLETGVYLIELVNDLEKSWKKVIVE